MSNKILVCHTDLVMKSSGRVEAIKGKEYPALDDQSDFAIINESGEVHHLATFSFNDETYKNWFTLKDVSRVQQLIDELKLLTGAKEVTLIK